MMGWKNQAQVENIKKKYPIGTRIELDYMDERDMDKGLKGIVDFVDDQGQLHMIWENGRTLALVPGEDMFHVLPQYELQKNEFEEGMER